jgi:uncharacterized Rmd1/YagE family protein
MLPGLDIEATSRRLKAIVKYNDTRDFYDLYDSVEFNHHLHQNNSAPPQKRNVSKHGRMIMYPKDMQVIYGITEESSWQLINKIRNYQKLPKGAPVLIIDFCEYTGFSHNVVLDFTNGNFTNEISWMKYYYSRDWYDLPDSKDNNQLLYQKPDGIGHRWNKDRNGRWIIFPRDIEVIYDCTPEAASEFIKDIRESLNLSISCPVMNYDLMNFTKTDRSMFLDFIQKS